MKRLVEIDDETLDAARKRLGTSTIKDTVNTALRLAADEEQEAMDVDSALDALAAFDLPDRAQAWR